MATHGGVQGVGDAGSQAGGGPTRVRARRACALPTGLREKTTGEVEVGRAGFGQKATTVVGCTVGFFSLSLFHFCFLLFL